MRFQDLYSPFQTVLIYKALFSFLREGISPPLPAPQIAVSLIYSAGLGSSSPLSSRVNCSGTGLSIDSLVV